MQIICALLQLFVKKINISAMHQKNKVFVKYSSSANIFKILKNIFLIAILFIINNQTYSQTLSSPDSAIKVIIDVRSKIYYSVLYKGKRVLDPSPLSISVLDKNTVINPKVLKTDRLSAEETIKNLWGIRKNIHDQYNQLELTFAQGYSVVFRAYNTGVAYRFKSSFTDKQIIVQNEEVNYRFGFNVSCWLPQSKSYETNYSYHWLDAGIGSGLSNIDKIYLPIVIEHVQGPKILITEASLYNYPSLFLCKGNDYENFFQSAFEKYALETQTGGFSNYFDFAVKEADYIANIPGYFEFPWRVMIISDDDRDFIDCDLVYQLSKPSVLENHDWIKPGKVAWEWWHDYVVEGQPFKGGVNTQTYLYHIDFASEYKLEYILIDWLWTDKYDLTLVNPDVDINQIVDYANRKNIGVIVWCPSHSLYKQLDKALDLFQKFGVKGIKTDFFAREDQTGIRMYEEIAKAAAKRKLLVDFHGATKPTGLSRTYPNIINYEAVLGNEYNKLEDKCTVGHKVLIPFIRGAIGPMDFTPGGMRNTLNRHSISFNLPQVHGTRCNEMALYVIYFEPLKMLCDAPSYYRREKEITQYISEIPTVWDDTKVLEAKFGEYILMARRHGDTWYIAGITGNNSRLFNIQFDFLGNDKYSAKILRDGINADRIATDYVFEQTEIHKNSILQILAQKSGGFVIKLKK
jgi:alpha-glucosidase